MVQMGDSLSPTPATTAEEALASSQEAGAVGGPAREGEGAVGGEETWKRCWSLGSCIASCELIFFRSLHKQCVHLNILFLQI